VTEAEQLARDRHWLQVAIDLSRRCVPSRTAFSVGALVVDVNGNLLAGGHSRETDPLVHAEESAIAKLGSSGRGLGQATIYSSLEPCSARRSRPRACADLILAAGIGRVVFALREPTLFAEGRGAERLMAAGVEVTELAELADQVRAINAHLGVT
jgi:diaminohydroxyphosphoribosylaminopyrimidine deaminase / 5-amino-6-(5-phosphoribosylamino)uracil reductase